MAIQVVILAAGQGKRMYSSLPKVLHPLAGKPLLAHVVDKALAVSNGQMPIVITGHQSQAVRQAFTSKSVKWVDQQQQLGTAHALMQALPFIAEGDQVLVLYGDVPLLSLDTLQQLIAETKSKSIGMVTAVLDSPVGYGRIKRDKKKAIIAIVEEKDASMKERAIKEVNSGIYLVPAKALKKWLPKIKNNNAQKEFYLTDIIAQANKDKVTVKSVQPLRVEEIMGVNDRRQLANLERFYQQQMANYWMDHGVTLLDPKRFDVRGEVSIGEDTIIDVNVILEGNVSLGRNVKIGPNVVIRDSMIGDEVEIRANSVIDGASIGSACVVGPFARLRPDTLLASRVHIGNFVEVKKSNVGEGTKVPHLSYIGDSDIGKRVNIGAGTITCNYDGAVKHKTIIHDNVHIGSDTQLVAPVTIGEGADIGAGSTVTKNVPARELTLTHRLEQRSVKGWKRPEKKQCV